MSRKRKRSNGDGILLERVQNVLKGPRQHAPPSVRKWLGENDERKIVQMEVGIQPIKKPLPTVLNALTRGKYEKVRRAAGYNDINHSYVVITLDNGEKYKVEKNHVVEITPFKGSNDKRRPVDLERPLKVSTFLTNAEARQELEHNKGQRPDSFWKYDPINNNCQYFVDDIIKGNAHDINNTKEVNEFSFQPEAAKTIEDIPNIARAATDIAATIDRGIHGEGMKKKKRLSYHFSFPI